MDIDEMRNFVEQQIPVGKELFRREIKSKEDFERLDEEASRWSSYNKEWIKLRLGYSEYSDYSLAAVHSDVSFIKNLTSYPPDQAKYYRDHIQEQVRQLESIQARLPLWEADQRAADQRAAEQRAAEQRAADQRAAEQRAAAQRTADRRAAEQRAAEQRAAEQRAAEQRAAEQQAAEQREKGSRPSPDAPIFIVHGRDTNRAQLVARAVERATKREVVILREQPSGGRTLIEKFEGNAADAAYAIVLITADDQGGLVNSASLPRGRQNVIFEMGYFYGRIGRNYVCVLLDPEVEQPSDMNGIVYIEFGDDAKWKQELFRELHHAGFEIDWSRIPS